MGKFALSDKGAEFEFNKDDQEFVSKISKHNFFGIIGDHIAMWRWQNAAIIIARARKFAEAHNIEPNKIPSKFLIEFMDNASVEEEESLQNMWAKILAKESDNPETFSFRTLNILKLMNKSDAQNFTDIAKYLLCLNNEYFLINDNDIHTKHNLNYNSLMKLEELGLITLNPMLSLQVEFSEVDQAAIYSSKDLIMVKQKPEADKKTLSISSYTLTTVGKQLLTVIDIEENTGLIKDFALKLKSENADLIVTLHKINTINKDNGHINFQQTNLL